MALPEKYRPYILGNGGVTVVSDGVKDALQIFLEGQIL